MILITSFLIAMLSALIVYLLMIRKKQLRFYEQINRRLHGLQNDLHVHREEKSVDISFFTRAIKPFVDEVYKNANAIAPTSLPSLIEKQIILAGKQDVWNINAFVVFWLVSVTIFSLITFIFLNHYSLMFIQKITGAVIGGFIGSLIPFLVLKNTIQKRQKMILRQLPDFLDMLCVSVQAGLSFEGALLKLVARMKGPLIEEFKRVQRDAQLGISRKDSLQKMAKRCDLEEIYLFTSSIIQSEKLGTSMAKTLANQADNMRDRHRQYIKAEALKAPIKIIFPLVLFIFPVIFVIVLLPSLMSLASTLK